MGHWLDETALRAAFPPLDGTLPVPGFEAPVRVRRDPWGIPHLRAEGPGDAFRALGFVHAQDRLWQMDMARRRAVGRSAEWLGKDAVAADALARRLDVAGASRRDYDAAAIETRDMLRAYAEGVNAFADRGPLPVEYRLLDAVPEPWEPWQSIAAMRQRGILMGSVWFKLWRAAALRAIGPGQISKLRYDDGGSELLCIPPGSEAARWIATLQDLAPSIEAVAALGAADATGGGSNNWALGPARTASGRPLVAGDPHRQFEIPGMYAQTHLACAEFDVIGLTVPGVPAFPHFAHNGRVAWCVTHAFADIHDLFVERVAGDAYLFKGEQRPLRHRAERIDVAGGPPVDLTVTETHHGPAIVEAPGALLTLRSVQVAETDRSLDCLIPMMRAGSVEALFEATRGWGLIDHNLVAADTAGRIGHLVRAVVPKRPRLNGWLPVPGWTGDHEWDGAIPFEAMPVVYDPPGGTIVTANNRVVADGDPYLMTDCHPPYRARRVAERLATLEKATVADMTAIHMDVASPNAALLLDRIRRLTPADPAARRARDTLAVWNGRMDAAATAPTLYAATRRALTRILLDRSGLAKAAGDPLLAGPPPVAPMAQLWWTLPTLLRADDASLLGGLTWDGAIAQALAAAAAEPERTWAEAHRARFVHPLSPRFPETAPLLDPTARPIGGDNDCVLATGLLAGVGLPAAYGPVARYVFDVGDWEASRWVVFHGASGLPGHAHWEDQHALWASGSLVPMIYGEARVEAAAIHSQTLAPA